MAERRRMPLAAEEYAPEVREPAGYRQSDAALGQRILDRLADDRELDCSGLAIEVDDGEVTVRGSMRCSADIRKVEEHACSVEGVRLVRNELASADGRDAPVAEERAAGAAARMGKPAYER